MRFSVVIPLYNKAPYVRKALESVFAQTFRDFELIVVDDGSRDESYNMAQSALDRCEVPYQLIHQENAGVSTARNNGVAASRGDYLCFLDADDWWAPEFLKKMDVLIRDYPDAAIYGTNYYYVKNGTKRICVEGAQTGYINYCQIYAAGMAMPLTSISVGLRRDTFLQNGGFKSILRLGEDFDLWIRVALSGHVAFLDEPLAYYNQDVNADQRGIGHLVNPKYHMLWNLDYLAEEERTNSDYKQLIDNLRTYSLMSYYLSREYRLDAKRELLKVDWRKQPAKIRFLYKMPVFLLKGRNSFLKFGSAIKQWLIRHL